MKIITKKCPGCGRRVQYILHDDGSGWFNGHKNRQGVTCDEKPKPRVTLGNFLKLIRK